MSSRFGVVNGVKQGGVLSPLLLQCTLMGYSLGLRRSVWVVT